MTAGRGSLNVVSEQDYFYETPESLNDQLAGLEAQARKAREEADEARRLPGLEGPAEAADADRRQLDAQLRDLRLIQKRIDASGYAYCERFGLEEAMDACYDASSRRVLAETVTPEYVYGHDVEIRMPADAQEAYRHALASGFFSRFEVWSGYETDGYEAVEAAYNYLFGVATLETREALFLVAEWSG